RRHTRFSRDWSSDVCSSDLNHPHAQHAAVTPGIHAMSNGAFDAPWPKSTLATKALEAWIESVPGNAGLEAPPDIEPLFTALADRSEERRVGKGRRCPRSAVE